MFRGQFLHSIDMKGRVSLPARLRDAVPSGEEGMLIVTQAPFASEPCLHVYTLSDWERVEQRIDGAPRLNRRATQFRRLYLSAATECGIDKSGRILIPPVLREHAKLEKEVLWAGMGNMLELWSRPLWDQHVVIPPEDEEAFEEAIREMNLI
jgi:MraZ protein